MKWRITVFDTTDDTNAKEVYACASQYGAWLSALWIVNRDTIDHAVNITLRDGTNDHTDTLTVPAGSRTNVLSPAVWTFLDPNNIGLPVAYLGSIRMGLAVAMSSGKTLSVMAISGDYTA